MWRVRLTSFREEGAEALILILGFALLSEHSIGLYHCYYWCYRERVEVNIKSYLDTMLKAVELRRVNVSTRVNVGRSTTSNKEL